MSQDLITVLSSEWINRKEKKFMIRSLTDKSCGIGGREGAKEGELEWERKNDQPGEDLLE